VELLAKLLSVVSLLIIGLLSLKGTRILSPMDVFNVTEERKFEDEAPPG
jgi:hypothetical protein